jgi:hypothetical protein
MLASASAAALTTLAVTVAVPVLADDGGRDNGADGIAACLRDHGLDGAPDGAALKPWLGARLDRRDATAEQALADCSPKPRIVEVHGPSEQELRSCLTEHGVEIPGGDAVALKRWLLAHGDEAANRDAMKACTMAPIAEPGVRCEKEGVVATASPAGRADDKGATVARGAADVQKLDDATEHR